MTSGESICSWHQFQRAVGEELDVKRGARNHAREIAHQQRSVVGSLDRGEFFGMIEDRLCEFFQNAMTSVGSECPPISEMRGAQPTLLRRSRRHRHC